MEITELLDKQKIIDQLAYIEIEKDTLSKKIATMRVQKSRLKKLLTAIYELEKDEELKNAKTL